MSEAIKLSSPATRGFWEIPVLFEDEHLLALDKPTDLLVSPDRDNAELPSLMALLHAGIESGKSWAQSRGLTYLMNAHRLDQETSGVILLVKTKPMLIAMADLFGSENVHQSYLALVHGNPVKAEFEVDAKLAPHPVKAGLMRVDEKIGKQALTRFELLEKFNGYSLLQCFPVTVRPHQIRVHLRQAGLPITGDALYGGSPVLLSRLKSDYHLKPHKTEKPLIERVALHATELKFKHPVTGAETVITSPWPKDIVVAVKYLRRFSAI